MELFFLSFGALFSVINPLGTLPIFIGLTKTKHATAIASTALWTAINTFIILLISFYLGKYLLTFFGVSLSSLKIAGGLIITSSGFALLTGNFTQHKGMKKREKDDAFTRSEISLTPLAIPMLAGPGSISLLITFNHDYPFIHHQFSIVASIFAVCLATYILLISSRVFIVISIGIEYIVSTILDLFNNT